MIMRTVMLKKKKNSPTFLDLKKKILNVLFNNNLILEFFSFRGILEYLL